MSIASTVNKNIYLGNNSTKEYDYTFKIFKSSDLTVIIKNSLGVETTLSSVDYTVTGVKKVNGGTVVLVGPRVYLDVTTGNLLSGFTILVKRVLGIIQETDIRNQGDFFPEVHEDTFDRLIMVDQQQQEQIDRAVVLSAVTSGFNPTLPSTLASNPNATFAVNATGDGFKIGPTTDQIGGASGSAAAAAASAVAASNSASAASNSASAASNSAAAASASATAAAASVVPAVLGSVASPIVITTQLNISSVNNSSRIVAFVSGAAVSILTANIVGGNFSGQMLIIIGTSNTSTVTLTDGLNGPITFQNNTIGTFIYNGSSFVEMGRNQ